MASRRRRLLPIAAPRYELPRARPPVVVIGVQPRALTTRRAPRLLPTQKKRVIPRRPIYHHTVVKPVRATIVGRPGRLSALLGEPHGSPKKRKLCKCTNDRSDAQRRVSRNFFAAGGGGAKPKPHACTC